MKNCTTLDSLRAKYHNSTYIDILDRFAHVPLTLSLNLRGLKKTSILVSVKPQGQYVEHLRNYWKKGIEQLYFTNLKNIIKNRTIQL